VGCGTGAALARLRRTHGVRWAGGVELVPAAAAEARAHLDAVWEGDVEELALPIPPASLDLVLCLDVLEHLRDPWAAAARLAALLRPGGALVASVPNAQHYSVSLPLLVGRHPFEASGLRDRTHLHPYVRATAVELVAGAGLRVDRVHAQLGRRVRALDALTLGALRGLFTVQYFVRGVRPG
jgi:2-polyprenyl-3-methyl-5-hydroxy-6-metoxy-1,4-benzoquinol methylase